MVAKKRPASPQVLIYLLGLQNELHCNLEGEFGYSGK